MQSDIVIDEIHLSEDTNTYSLNIGKDNDAKLLPGTSLPSIQAVTMLVSWFSSFPGMSKESFSNLLNILAKHILPASNILPTSYSSALKLIQPYLSCVQEFHCCINDCVLFRKTLFDDYTHLKKCPVCDEERFEDDSSTPRRCLSTCP